MKNVFGKQEELELFNKEGELVYEFKQLGEGWSETTYDEKGNQLTFKNSKGFWSEYTYDDNGNKLTYKNSEGFWSEYTYDKNGNQLTYRNSEGESSGLDIPEYTMEELVKKIGNFKIKK
jgi:YD repeat-containing protein